MMDQNLIINSLAILLSICITLLLYVSISSRMRFAKLSSIIKQIEIERAIMSEQLSDMIQKDQERQIDQSEGFVRYLSDSRQKAFEYIESVQRALTVFDSEISPELDWNSKFGGVLGDSVHTKSINKIQAAYENLKQVMPENKQGE